MNPIVNSIIRAALMAASGVLGTKYGISVDPTDIDAIALGITSVVLGVGSIGWSIYEKRSVK